MAFIIGFLYRKSVAAKRDRLCRDRGHPHHQRSDQGRRNPKKRESILEAKDEIHKQRVEADRELKERRNETQQLERRLIQREEALDKKSDMLDRQK